MSEGGVFRGARERNVDYFDDVMGDNSTPAIFDGDGARNYDKMEVQADQKGITVKMHCRSCRLEGDIEITWAELFVVAHAPRSGLLPEGWQRSEVNQAAYPLVNCKCGTLMPVNVQPDWAMRRVDSALRAGLTSAEDLRQDPQVQVLQRRMAGQR